MVHDLCSDHCFHWHHPIGFMHDSWRPKSIQCKEWSFYFLIIEALLCFLSNNSLIPEEKTILESNTSHSAEEISLLCTNYCSAQVMQYLICNSFSVILESATLIQAQCEWAFCKPLAKSFFIHLSRLVDIHQNSSPLAWTMLHVEFQLVRPRTLQWHWWSILHCLMFCPQYSLSSSVIPLFG